ncbi:MAG: RelA/SpoT domain-containing protein, partial [Pseudomonadota bacterium]|nr:RelA/SpoT domain-containing protein [Pseudomonadota bacterium]
MTLSNSQVTKLGDRLRSKEYSEKDLGLLDDFRQTFSEVDELAYTIIQNTVAPFAYVTLTKRKRKTQQSIVDKLRREKRLRLPQMQDIAGCRIVIDGGLQRAEAVDSALTRAFEEVQWQIESKVRHKYGYHAIHLIMKKDAKFYEIQLRTYAQDIWANLVERMSDDKNTLKYGGSEQEQPLMSKLMRLADTFSDIDQSAHEMTFADY